MVSRKNSWSQCHAIISVVIKHNIWKNSDDIEIEPFYNDAICKSKLDKEKYQDGSHHHTRYKQQRRLQ